MKGGFPSIDHHHANVVALELQHHPEVVLEVWSSFVGAATHTPEGASRIAAQPSDARTGLLSSLPFSRSACSSGRTVLESLPGRAPRSCCPGAGALHRCRFRKAGGDGAVTVPVPSLPAQIGRLGGFSVVGAKVNDSEAHLGMQTSSRRKRVTLVMVSGASVRGGEPWRHAEVGGHAAGLAQ